MIWFPHYNEILTWTTVPLSPKYDGVNPHETVLELESPAGFGDIELFVRTANQTARTDFADPE